MKKSVYFREDIRDSYPLNWDTGRRSEILQQGGKIFNINRLTSGDRIRTMKQMSDVLNSVQLRTLHTLRTKTKESLLARGYLLQTDTVTDWEIQSASGIPITDRSIPPEAMVHAAVLNPYMGMVELPHTPLLKNMLERVRARAGTVLDLGCGFSPETKLDYEYLCNRIVYLDNDQRLLDILRESIEVTLSSSRTKREFVYADKEKLDAAVAPETMSAIIRNGVFETSDAEMQGIHRCLKPKGELFVSNSLERQPAETFLSVMEQFPFSQIDVHLGLERYAVVAQKM